MNVSVRANARVAEAARGGVAAGARRRLPGGSVTGLLVVGLALLGVAGYYGILTSSTGEHDKEAVDALDRPRLRRLADLGLRPSRRRHLHQGRRRRRRPRRQDRGRHPRGRPAQPGRDRRQRGRQRRRLRRHGGRPVRDLRGHRGRRDAARRPHLPERRSPRGRALPARARRRLDPRLDHRHASRCAAATGNVERRALPGPDRRRRHRRGRVLPDHRLADGRPRLGVAERAAPTRQRHRPLALRADRPRRHRRGCS